MYIKMNEDHDGYKAGEVVEVSPGYGEHLVEQGKAVEAEAPKQEIVEEKPKKKSNK